MRRLIPGFARFFAVALALLFAPESVASQLQSTSIKSFDANMAWTSFKKLLREEYGYFNRPGIDGEAIIANFDDRAKAAKTDDAFINVLQLVSHNFADPHFIVGPFEANDWAVIPTSSDLVGSRNGPVFRIDQVRADSDALLQGVVPGMIVLGIDGQSPSVVIEEITGRKFEALSSNQVEFAFNIALAGRRGQLRKLDVLDGRHRRTLILAATSVQAKRISQGPLLDVERQGEIGIIRINNSLGNPDVITAFSNALGSLADTSVLLIDLRNTPSGGNTSVARGIMGHFVYHDRPYQKCTSFRMRPVYLGPLGSLSNSLPPMGSLTAGKSTLQEVDGLAVWARG